MQAVIKKKIPVAQHILPKILIDFEISVSSLSLFLNITIHKTTPKIMYKKAQGIFIYPTFFLFFLIYILYYVYVFHFCIKGLHVRGCMGCFFDTKVKTGCVTGDPQMVVVFVLPTNPNKKNTHTQKT